MRHWSWLLVAAVAVTPALAAEKKKDEKKGKEAQAAQPAAAQDIVKQAEAMLAGGDAEGAAKLLETAMATDGRAALRLGILREGRGELDGAIDAYKAAAEKLSGPEKGEALGRMAVAQDTRGMAQAGANAEAAIAADPEGAWPAIAMSYRRVHEGKADEAVGLAQKAVAAGTVGAKAALGRALEAKGETTGAEAAYREAMAAEPGAMAPVVGLATVLRRTNRAAEAEPMLKKVVDASPGAIDAHKELARVMIAMGRAQEALGEANLAAAMAENDPDAQKLVLEVKVARALQDLGQGQTDLATQDLTQLRDQNPDSAAVRLGLGRAQIARRDAAAAVPELQKAVELEPKNAEAQYQLGFVQHVMKRNAAAAVPAFEQAVALEPSNALFRTALGGALVEAGQLDRAVQELTKVTSAEGYSGSEAWFYLGTAHFNAKRYKESAAALEKSLAVKPDNAQAEGLLAWSYVALKDTENFKKHGANARKLGFKDADLMARLAKIEAGEKFK